MALASLPSPPGSVTELASGVDALYLSGRADLPVRLIAALEVSRERADEAGDAVEFEPLGDGWRIAGHGFGKYRFSLSNEAGQLGVTLSERLPTLRVQVRAEFLHAVGPQAVLDYFGDLCERLVGGPVAWGLSRLDLFCDVQGWSLGGDDRQRFVCRAAKRDLYEDGEDLDGYGFGRRTTKTVSARIYDKTREIAKKGSDWWPIVWGSRFDQERPVLRVEFELGRKGLTEFGVDTPTDGLARAAGIWGNLTEGWLTYRIPTGDGTKARWPVASEWEAIQAASLRSDAIGLGRVRAGKRTGELRKLIPGLVGYCASAGALTGANDIDATIGSVRQIIRDDEIRRGIAFADRIAERRERLAAP
jgi:hypothetical protein